MSDNFAVLDFALLGATPQQVAEALIALDKPAATPAPVAEKPSLLRRFLGRKPVEDEAAKPLAIQPTGALPKGVIAREVIEDLGFGGSEHATRLSSPVGRNDYTLLEFREREDGGASPRLLQLSEALPGVEILGFRLSGARHPGAEFGFSVYRNGKAVRRLGTRSLQGLSDDADWQVTDSGVPHRSEARLRPGPAPADKLTPAMQAQLLEALGVDPDAFLEDRSAYTEVIELSTRPVAPEAPAPTSGTTPAAPTPEEKAETHPAPAADQKAEPEPKQPAAQPASLPTGAAWEEEVTSLLIDAVNDALPTEAQVSWLDALTTQLNAGDIDAALASAAALITNGNRPEATKQAAISRLTVLFSARG